MSRMFTGPLVGTPIEFEGKSFAEDASHCTDAVLCAVACAIWPKKTAANWAVAAGVQERMVKYWMAGTYPVSDTGRRAIVRLLA